MLLISLSPVQWYGILWASLGILLLILLFIRSYNRRYFYHHPAHALVALFLGLLLQLTGFIAKLLVLIGVILFMVEILNRVL